MAFAVGAFTELPALRDFTLYASLGIAFDFVYQVTFFAALVVLDARREQRARLGAPGWGFQCGCGKTEFDTLPSEQVSVSQLKDLIGFQYLTRIKVYRIICVNRLVSRQMAKLGIDGFY